MEDPMSHTPPPATGLGIHHHDADVNGTVLHYVAAGDTGSPILLVHGFPETWWAFHKLIPLLAAHHRVFAVDLRGFGDSAVAGPDHDSSIAAADVHALIRHLDVGPVSIAGQDIAGGALYRLAVEHPEDLSAVIATEMGLAGFGLEAFADVAHGGSWHIGVLAARGIPELLFTGREAALLGEWAFPSMTAVADAITPADITEFARGFARPGGWNGATGLYRSMLAEGDEFRETAARTKLRLPVLTVGGFGGGFTENTLRNVSAGPITSAILEGVGHYVALEAPEQLANAILTFLRKIDVRS